MRIITLRLKFMLLTYEKINSGLSKGKVALCYFLYGDEDYLIDELVRKIISVAVEKDTEDFNLDILYGNEVDGGQVVSLAMSYPMMANRRTVVVKGVHRLSPQSLTVIGKYLDKPSPTTCLVMTANRVDLRKKGFAKLKKQSTCFEAKVLYENKIPDWIRTFVAAKGLSISEEAIRLLQVCVGTSLRSLSSEIEKVLLNIEDRKKIAVEDIEAVVGVSKQFNTFELCDAVGKRDIAKSLYILNHMLRAGEAPTGIVAMLTRHFTILAKVKRLAAQRWAREKIAAAVGVHPFFVQNYLQQAPNYQVEEINNAFNHLLDVDIKLKSTGQKPKMVLEVLLFTLITGQGD